MALGVILMEGCNEPRILRVRVTRLLDGFAGGEPALPPSNEAERIHRQTFGKNVRFDN